MLSFPTVTPLIVVMMCLASLPACYGQETITTEPPAAPAASENLFSDDQPWLPERGCRLVVRRDITEITAVGGEPVFFRRLEKTCGQVDVAFRFRTRVVSNAIVQWVTKTSPRRSDDKKIVIPLIADGQWHTYRLSIPVFGVLLGVSIRLSETSGVWEFGTGPLISVMEHPLFLARGQPTPSVQGTTAIDSDDERLARARITITNTGPTLVDFEPAGMKQRVSLLPSKSIALQLPTERIGSLRTAAITLKPNEFPAVTHAVFFYSESATTSWTSFPIGELAIRREDGPEEPLFTLEFADDGTVARLRRLGETVAVWGPLATTDHRVCVFTLAPPERAADGTLTLTMTSPHLAIDWRISGDEVQATLRALETASSAPPAVVTGPRLRVLGRLQRGLLAGVEMLSEGDVSSSPLDIEPPKNRRRQPRPTWMTMPLAVLASDGAAISLRWDDLTLQPSFASPDYIEDVLAHAVSLTTDQWPPPPMTMVFRIQDPARASDPIAAAVAWCLAHRGLPKLSPFPRAWDEQRQLCLKGMERLAGPDQLSWSYSTEASEPKLAYADFLSAYWRLSGAVPQVTAIEAGGGDISNESIYFVVGRAAEWKQLQQILVQHLVSEMKEDRSGNGGGIGGMFLCRSRFPDVESASSAIGYDATQLMHLTTQVLTTSDEWLTMQVNQGLRSLVQTPIPRGGFYRDTTVHTPDLLSAATLCRLFTAAYQHSGRDEWRAAAVRFALLGLTFVYQRDDNVIPNYATVPMLGASGRSAPVWFGTARPQTGLVFADALLELGLYDTTFDWPQIAHAIVAFAEDVQFTEGPMIGCVPDYVVLETGRAATLAIHPADLALVRMRCEGIPTGISILVNRQRRESLMAPFPIAWNARGAEAAQVPAGLKFQLLHQGRDVIEEIGSGSGHDQITLE